MNKTFTDALVRRLNRACREIKQGDRRCEWLCFGIGWCEECWRKAEKKQEVERWSTN